MIGHKDDNNQVAYAYTGRTYTNIQYKWDQW